MNSVKAKENSAVGYNAALLRYMPAIMEQKHELRMVEAAWENLSLLSSLSALTANQSTGRELDTFKHEFSVLSREMVSGLVQEELRQLGASLKSKAQFCIDILVRNLFERTADIGFLAEDEVFVDVLTRTEQRPDQRVLSRMNDYRSFYSVYSDLYLFDAQFQVIAASTSTGRLNFDSETLSAEDAAWLTKVAESQEPYTEFYGRLSFLRTEDSRLVYAKRVRRDGVTIGVLCMVFRLQDELAAIFKALRGDRDDQSVVLCILDSQGKVIGSNDPLQMPLGMIFDTSLATRHGVVRHMGRSYLAYHVQATSFEGYAGPGWIGVAMLAMDVAFDETQDEEQASDLMEEVASHSAFLQGNLQSIPVRSKAIQSALDRSVWNGLIDIARARNANKTRVALSENDIQFARTLLSEIGSTARKTAGAFSAAVNKLHRVVAGSMVSDALHRSDLVMQILDRNLYERANDCRWWAMTPKLQAAVRSAMDSSATDTEKVLAEAHELLCLINSLYTVYQGIVIFDAQGHVLSTSRDDWQGHVGARIDECWVSACMTLQQAHQYAVSPWKSNVFSPQEPTFVYASAIRAENGHPIGGIGLIWKGVDQMQAMLADCADHQSPLDALCFVSGNAVLAHHGHVVEDHHLKHGLEAVSKGRSRKTIVAIGERLCGTGMSSGIGYREYRANNGYQHGVQAIVFRHLCDRQSGAGDATWIQRLSRPQARTERRLTLGTFMVGERWLALPAENLLFASPLTRFMPVHRGSSGFCGIIEIDKKVYPVAKMTELIEPSSEAGQAADGLSQVIVIEVPAATPSNTGHSVQMALIVDGLGPILEFDADNLQPSYGISSMISHVVGVPVQPVRTVDVRSGMLALDNGVSKERLLSMLNPSWFLGVDQRIAA